MRTDVLQVVSICLIVLATVSIAAPVASESKYDLEVADSISTPEETVEIEGTEYPVDGVGVIEPGEPIEIDVTSPEQYRIYLYNTDEKTEFDNVWGASENHVAMGTEDDALDTSTLEPGTYMLSLEVRGEGRQAVYPVVIEAFDLSVEYPETASADEEVEFTATTESAESATNADTVDVAVWNEADEEGMDLELDSQGDGTYRTTVDASEFGEGEYNVYSAVVGEDEAQGYPTAMAVDNGPTFTVTAEESDNDDTTTGGGSGSAPSDGGSEDENENESPTDDTPENESTPANETEPVDDGDTSVGNETSETDNSDSNNETDTGDLTEPDDGDEDNESNTSDRQTLEPNNESEIESTNTDDDSLSIPGFGPLVAVLALLLVGYRAAH